MRMALRSSPKYKSSCRSRSRGWTCTESRSCGGGVIAKISATSWWVYPSKRLVSASVASGGWTWTLPRAWFERMSKTCTERHRRPAYDCGEEGVWTSRSESVPEEMGESRILGARAIKLWTSMSASWRGSSEKEQSSWTATTTSLNLMRLLKGFLGERKQEGLKWWTSDGGRLSILLVKMTSPRSMLAKPSAVKVSLNTMSGSQMAEWQAVNGLKKWSCWCFSACCTL